MLFFVIFASSTPDKYPFFEISEMTTHPTMTITFESVMLSFSPGVNSRAELVTSPRAYARNGASRRWLGDK